MKNHKFIEELNKEWAKYGFRINEEGEIIGNYEGKEQKFGQIKRRVVSEEDLKNSAKEDKKTKITSAEFKK